MFRSIGTLGNGFDIGYDEVTLWRIYRPLTKK